MLSYVNVMRLANDKGFSSNIDDNRIAAYLKIHELIEWLEVSFNCHIEPISSIDDKGKVNKVYRVLFVYKADTKKFPSAKYSYRDYVKDDLLSAIESALQLL